MKTPTSKVERSRGFSLIEVLVAVAIMSFGLLALATLQLSLVRSSADAKAQTVATALAKEKIESVRSFLTLSANANSYRSLTAPATGTVENLTDSGDMGGGVFTRTTMVSRYLYDKAASKLVFVGLTNAQNTLTDAQIQALNNNDGVTSPQYAEGKDFKRVTVLVAWQDAAGQALQVRMEDIVDSLDPTESAAILGSLAGSGSTRRLEKKISDPALDAMVIPIAVGGGSESAASNPKPVVVAGSDTIQTTFDVITYNGVNNGTATAQQEVHNDIVACTCSLASPPASTVRGMRPTYWNGGRYATPKVVDTSGAASYSPPAKLDSTFAAGKPQAFNQLCTVCCRDHHDPVGVKGATFSPRLITRDSNDVVTASSHAHFLANSTGSAWSVPVANGQYSEACRVLEVDGFHRVAADLSNDYFNLLATQDLTSSARYASSPVPDATALTNYQGFVVGYLDARFTNNTNAATFNVLPSTSTLESTYSLGLPASIPVASTFNGTIATKTITGITQANPAVVTIVPTVTKNITAITRANPAVVTSTAHGFVNNDRVRFAGLGGMTALNGNSYVISGVTANTFKLTGVDSSSYPAFSGGGTATLAFENGDRVTLAGVVGMIKAVTGSPTVSLNGRSFIIAGVTATTFQLTGADTTTYSAYGSGGTAVVNHGKWLHSRGLYQDYLEKDAIAAVVNSKATCPSQTGTGYSDCVLKVLPFTSINLTEIADWLSAATGTANVTTNDYSDSSTRPDPVRGKVSVVPTAANGASTVVSSLSRKRNTGLLDLTTNAISATDDQKWNTNTVPAQTFVISNPAAPPAAPDTFYARLSLAPKSGLAVNYITGGVASRPCSNFDAGKALYPCQVLNQALPTAGLGVANSMAVEVVGYNSATALASIALPSGTLCAGPNGTLPYNPSTSTPANLTYTPRTCSIYPTPTAVNTTTGLPATSATPTNGTLQSAKTVFNFLLITGDGNTADTSYQDLITVTFGAPTNSAAPITCSYTCSNPCNSANAAKTPTFTATTACP